MRRLLKSGMVAVAVAGVIGLGMGMRMSTLAVGQTLSQVSQQDELAEQALEFE